MDRFLILDDNESMFFQRELEYLKPKIYEIQFPKLKATSLIPVSTEAGPGAESIVYQVYEELGLAQIIASYADDLPRADVKGKEYSSIIKTIGDSYGWNLQEIKAAMHAGKPLQMKRAAAARRAFDTLVDNIAWFGDQENNLAGFLTNENIPASLADTGDSGKTTWEDKTADEILDDLNGMVQDIIDLTNEVEAPDTILLPVAQYGLISTKPRSSTSDTTILEFFLKNSAYIDTVVPLNKLKNISPAIVGGGDSSDIAVAYQKDPDCLSLELPMPFTQEAAQARNLELVVPCWGRIGGVIIYRPLSMKILEGI